MHLPYSLGLAALFSLLTLTSALLPTHLVYEAPNGTWYENLAVRACGSILISVLTSPDLYLIDPLSPQPSPKLVHHFDSAFWLLGITETCPDVFQVVAANGTLKSLVPAPGSNRIFQVSFRPGSDVPEVSLTATLAEAVFLNGLTTLNPTTVLAADSMKGVVWATDITTGVSRIAINDPLMAPSPAFPLGINGLRIHGSTLFFTNTAQQIFAKVEVNPDGTAAGPAVVVAHAPAGAGYDDFAVDWRSDAFVATSGGNSIEEIGRGGQPQTIIAGNINSTDIAEPTSAQFGRTADDWKTLYVTTGGGRGIPVNGHEILGGQLVAVDTRGLWRA